MESSTECTCKRGLVATDAKIINLRHLLSYLQQVTDGRKRRGLRYRLDTILILLLLAKLSGEDKVYGIADWVQQRAADLITMLGLQLKRPCLPHHSTYRRILTEVIRGEELEALMADYVAHLPGHGQEVIMAIDGKTVRGTISAQDPFGLHLLAAYLPESGLVLLQMEVAKEKENEIVVAPKLLACLDLRQKVVVGDAMHTQRQLSVQIVAAGGAFVWIVKDNQPHTRQAIAQLFAPEKPIAGVGCPPMDFRHAKTVDKQAGRIEEREITVSSYLHDYLDWPHVSQVFKLERRFTEIATGKVTTEVQYGLTSLTAEAADAARLLALVRSEWGIENGLHYRLDFTFREDQTRMTDKRMGRAMAILNNLVISLFNHHGYTNHAHARRVYNANLEKGYNLICGL